MVVIYVTQAHMEIVLEAGSDILSQAYMLDTLSNKAALPLRNTIIYVIYR